MNEQSRKRFLDETSAARARAAGILEQLLAANQVCESQLKKSSRVDPIRLVTGRSSLDNAIAATRTMIESLDRAMQELMRGGETDDGLLRNAVVIARELGRQPLMA